MLKFVVLFVLIAVATGAVYQGSLTDPIPIVHSESNLHPDGSFVFKFEGGDGTYRQESGAVQNAGQENAYVAVQGSYKYFDAEGQPVEVQYTADEKGFLPSGPAIHPAIVDNARQVAGL